MKVAAHFVLWKLGLAKAETQTTEGERDCLARHAAGRRRVVEIGVWHGVTTRRLRRAMAAEGVLYAVDPYPAGRLGVSLQLAIAHREVQQESNGVVRWVRMTGEQAAQEFDHIGDGRPDFVFIDGDHSWEGLKGDWDGWSRHVVPDGVIALHDSRATPVRPIHDAGSVRFTCEVINRDTRFELIDVVDTLSVFRRRCDPGTVSRGGEAG